MQVDGECLENPRPDGKKSELPFPSHINQAAGLEFFDVMREGGGRNRQRFVRGRAAKGTMRTSDVFEQLEAFGIGEGLEDGCALGPGEAGRLR